VSEAGGWKIVVGGGRRGDAWRELSVGFVEVAAAVAAGRYQTAEIVVDQVLSSCAALAMIVGLLYSAY